MNNALTLKKRIKQGLIPVSFAGIGCVLLGFTPGLQLAFNTTFLNLSSLREDSQPNPTPLDLDRSALADELIPPRSRNARSLSPEKLEQVRKILIQDGLSPMEAETLLEQSLVIADDRI